MLNLALLFLLFLRFVNSLSLMVSGTLLGLDALHVAFDEEIIFLKMVQRQIDVLLLTRL